jgi:hypothetical protein
VQGDVVDFDSLAVTVHQIKGSSGSDVCALLFLLDLLIIKSFSIKSDLLKYLHIIAVLVLRKL